MIIRALRWSVWLSSTARREKAAVPSNKKRECGMEGFTLFICLIAACPSAAPQGAAEGQVGRRLHGASRAVQTAAHLCVEASVFI